MNCFWKFRRILSIFLRNVPTISSQYYRYINGENKKFQRFYRKTNVTQKQQFNRFISTERINTSRASDPGNLVQYFRAIYCLVTCNIYDMPKRTKGNLHDLLGWFVFYVVEISDQRHVNLTKCISTISFDRARLCVTGKFIVFAIKVQQTFN